MCAPSKIFEQILHAHVYNHVKNSINDHQHGFMSGRSINTSFISFTESANNALEKQLQLDVVYTDFEKAFDKVKHDVLLRKLCNFGLSDNLIKLFKSYLQNRSFVVKHNGNTSGKFKANSGVPQGSNLGPLLFLMFINDLANVIQYSDYLLFADDFKLFKIIQTVRDCVMIQRDIENILLWGDNNKIKFNINKCYVMSITRKREPIVFDYLIGLNVLKRTSEVKDLGLIYNNQLSFATHIGKAAKRANRMLGFICRQTCDFTSIKGIKILYNTLVRPILEFGSIIWGQQPQVHLEALEKVQNKFLRYLYFKKHHRWPDYGTIRSTMLREEFEVLSLTSRRKFVMAMILYKIINNISGTIDLRMRIPFNVPRKATRYQLLFGKIRTSVCSPLEAMLKLANNINLVKNIDFTMSVGCYRHIVQEHFKLVDG